MVCRMIRKLRRHKSKIALLGSVLGLVGVIVALEAGPILAVGAGLHTVYRILALE